MVIFKLVVLFIIMILFFWLFVFGPLYDIPAIQLGVLISVIGWNTLRYSLRKTMSLLKFCFPFV